MAHACALGRCSSAAHKHCVQPAAGHREERIILAEEFESGIHQLLLHGGFEEVCGRACSACARVRGACASLVRIQAHRQQQHGTVHLPHPHPLHPHAQVSEEQLAAAMNTVGLSNGLAVTPPNPEAVRYKLYFRGTRMQKASRAEGGGVRMQARCQLVVQPFKRSLLCSSPA